MDSIEVVLVMLLAVVASAYLTRLLPRAVPLPLVQIALGALIAAKSTRGVDLEPDLFFLVFLPPLLFLDGWRIPKSGLLRDKGTILELALGLVVFTVLGAGLLIHWLIPAMPLPVAFALAAIISPTDPIAVSSIAATTPIPKRLMHILEGESLLNDASGLVCFRFAVAAAMTGAFSVSTAGLTFVWLVVAGIGAGVGVTMLVTWAQRWLTYRFGEPVGSPILVNLLLPFGAYLVAERMHASGILAAVAAGITMSYVELSGHALANTRIQRSAVWDTVQFALNGIMFVLLGEQLPDIFRGASATIEESGHLNPWWLAVYAVAINVGLLMLRMLWVWASLRLTIFKQKIRHQPRMKINPRLLLATTLAGARGAITLAGVLTLPLALPDGSPFPARSLTIFLACSVILVSLLVASLGLPRLLAGMTFPPEPEEQREEDQARRAAANAAIVAIEHTQVVLMEAESCIDPEAYPQAAARVIAFYEHKLKEVDPENDAAWRKTDHAEKELRLAALDAERTTIYDLARHDRISDEISRKLVREIDLMEARYR
ncbi:MULTISPECIES: Na+/H+ antiporter [unclassified Duganella]|uniref:Na+/H+ antiporter n=1 Tax=unclassified Duganella TaxID=2636909 RepID=UPI000875A0E1|nr:MULTISPECIES: Na+/H+ antiporter [unclassified Duganella]OEZ58015.1 sodium, potassium, lithium and rubidium/H(+) antiporter [Duganella sp. HH105]OFA01758.1 sodium, potassium, lithium and rubidium/H(+) antiporter [Duganella sp. HH101]